MSNCRWQFDLFSPLKPTRSGSAAAVDFTRSMMFQSFFSFLFCCITQMEQAQHFVNQQLIFSCLEVVFLEFFHCVVFIQMHQGHCEHLS